MANYHPSDSIDCLSFVTDKEKSVLKGYFNNIEALLRYLPKRHEDRRRFDAFPNQPSLQPLCLRGIVTRAYTQAFGARKCFEISIEDANPQLFTSLAVHARWFGMPFMSQAIPHGAELILYGKVKLLQNRLVMDHPEFEVLKEGDPLGLIHTERIVPIYKNLSGISQRRLREILFTLLEQTDLESLQWDFDYSTVLGETLRLAHFPPSPEVAVKYRRAFALESFFFLQLQVLLKRYQHDQCEGRSQGRKTRLLKDFYHALPFDLTGAQKRCVHEIAADMRSTRAMHRLLQGDVGTGKTFVAMAAALLAIESQGQVALMAPTQILAEQHFLTFKKHLEPLGVKVALLTSQRDDGMFDSDAPPQMIIGTHALIFQSESMDRLSLIIIDEQHKFGVEQRSRLIQRAVTPDVLVMTATPIPRTLTMTVYGDLDVSLLDERPAGRGRVTTALRVSPKVTDVKMFIKDQLDRGKQIYLVYPLVDDSEKSSLESATQAAQAWQKRLPAQRVGLLHGKLKPEEKQQLMQEFSSGDIHVLVATTVIEVGVDVPNAAVMIIYHADRFGLAQLHQLRGRVGRGSHKGFCVLITDGKSTEAMEKLRVIEQSENGFEIAEADMRLRGPGDVLGTAQSGAADTKFSEFFTDIELILEARTLADKLIKEDLLLAQSLVGRVRLAMGSDSASRLELH